MNDILKSGTGGIAVNRVAQLARTEALAVPHIPSRRLDFLRGIAAMYVLIGHARGHLFAGGSQLAKTESLQWFDYAILALLQLTSMGTEAVIVFFVLSGFAMAHSFSHSSTPFSFYSKRLVRIWPPYLAAVALAFGCAAIILRSSDPNGITEQVRDSAWDIGAALKMVFYLDVNTVLTAQFWSLPQEVLFYLLCPLLLAGKSRVAAFFGVAVALTISGALIFGIYEDPTIGGGFVYRHFFTLLIFFMTGAIAYHYQHRIPRLTGNLLLVVFITSFAVIWFVKYQLFNGWNLISSLMTAPLAILLIGNVPPSLYQRKWFNWGHFSYSLYIVHMQLIALISYMLARVWALEQPQMNSYWMWMLAVPPITFLSWLFYLLTEKQCNAALARIRESENRDGASTLIAAPVDR